MRGSRLSRKTVRPAPHPKSNTRCPRRPVWQQFPAVRDPAPYSFAARQHAAKGSCHGNRLRSTSYVACCKASALACSRTRPPAARSAPVDGRSLVLGARRRFPPRPCHGAARLPSPCRSVRFTCQAFDRRDPQLRWPGRERARTTDQSWQGHLPLRTVRRSSPAAGRPPRHCAAWRGERCDSAIGIPIGTTPPVPAFPCDDPDQVMTPTWPSRTRAMAHGVLDPRCRIPLHHCPRSAAPCQRRRIPLRIDPLPLASVDGAAPASLLAMTYGDRPTERNPTVPFPSAYRRLTAPEDVDDEHRDEDRPASPVWSPPVHGAFLEVGDSGLEPDARVSADCGQLVLVRAGRVVRVALRRLDVAVAHPLLPRAHRHARGGQRRAEGAAQKWRCGRRRVPHPTRRQAGGSAWTTLESGR